MEVVEAPVHELVFQSGALSLVIESGVYINSKGSVGLLYDQAVHRRREVYEIYMVIRRIV